MYNSKDLVVDTELTFLSYNQTINAEFTVEEIGESDLWMVNDDNGLIKAIPLFNCDKIVSSNPSDIVLDDNKCLILQDVDETLIQCISNDTGGLHYYTSELYAYAPYSKLDVIDELTIFCIVYDEYLNTIGEVEIQVYIDDTLTDTILTNNNGLARYVVDQACEIMFKYGTVESNTVTITGGD